MVIEPPSLADLYTSREWSHLITGGIRISEYEDGDLVIADWAESHAWTELRLSFHQGLELYELLVQDDLQPGHTTSLGTDQDYDEVFVRSEQDHLRLTTETSEAVTLTAEQVAELLELLEGKESWIKIKSENEDPTRPSGHA